MLNDLSREVVLTGIDIKIESHILIIGYRSDVATDRAFNKYFVALSGATLYGATKYDMLHATTIQIDNFLMISIFIE